MKKFLILFILIVFPVVSCVGPNKVGWRKPDFRQDQLDKDRKDCEQSSKLKTYESDGNVVTCRETLEKCLRGKGYEPVLEEVPKEPLTVEKVLLTAAKVSLAVVLVSLMVLSGHLPI